MFLPPGSNELLEVDLAVFILVPLLLRILQKGTLHFFKVVCTSHRYAHFAISINLRIKPVKGPEMDVSFNNLILKSKHAFGVRECKEFVST